MKYNIFLEVIYILLDIIAIFLVLPRLLSFGKFGKMLKVKFEYWRLGLPPVYKD